MAPSQVLRVLSSLFMEKASYHTVSGHMGGLKAYPDSYYRPLYEPSTSNLDKISLAFVQKPIMTVALIVGYDKKWRVVKPRVDKHEEIESIFSPDEFTVVWTSGKSLEHPAIKGRLGSPNTLINCIPGASKLSIDKWKQYQLFQDYLKDYNTSVEDLRIMPATYFLHDMHRHMELLKATKPDSMWIVKTCVGFGGKDAKVFHTTSDLEEFLLTSDFGQNESECIVQEYITDLMLLSGRKFDIRVPILIANTRPFMLFYHDGYLRVAQNLYHPKGDLDVHLTGTTTQIATHGDSFQPEEHFWSFERLQTYLDIVSPDNGGFVQNRLIPTIEKMAIFFLKSGMHLIDRSPSCCQLIGLDLTLSSDGHVWFIETNNYIGLRRFGWMMDNNYNLVSDMFDLVIGMRKNPKDFIDMPLGSDFRSWRLIWRESSVPEQHSDYDPCRELNTKHFKKLRDRGIKYY